MFYFNFSTIPILGHFPSEITGKSLFALIHSDDIGAIIYAHQECMFLLTNIFLFFFKYNFNI